MIKTRFNKIKALSSINIFMLTAAACMMPGMSAFAAEPGQQVAANAGSAHLPLIVVLIIVVALLAVGFSIFVVYHFRHEAMIARENLQKEKEQVEALEKSKLALQDAYTAVNRAMDAKADFLAHMSHDMRTPMNAILGMSIVGKIHLSEKDKVSECLRKIHYSGMHLSTLINDVLFLTKMESGTMEIEEKAFNLREFIRNTETIIRDKADDKNLHFTVEVDDIEHEYVAGDMGHIRQVLIHLLENAVMYTPEGGNIKLTLKEDPGPESDIGCFEFIVSDDGIGISEEFQEHMFEPFSRESQDMGGDYRGSGLGLAIVYNIIQMMDGNITVESEQGKGSTFKVVMYLRLEQDAATEFIGQDEFEAETKVISEMKFSGKRVLLAEDNAFNADVAIELLTETGVLVDHVWNGQAAFDAVLDNAPYYYDLVLMDIQMPVMSGYDAARVIRSAGRTDMEQLPIIAVSANAFAEDISESFEAGMNGHIAKPLNMNSLASTLRQYLSD